MTCSTNPHPAPNNSNSGKSLAKRNESESAPPAIDGLGGLLDAVVSALNANLARLAHHDKKA